MLLPAVAAGMLMMGTQAQADGAPHLAMAVVADAAPDWQDVSPSTAPAQTTAQPAAPATAQPTPATPVQATPPAVPGPPVDAAQDIVVTGDKEPPKGDPRTVAEIVEEHATRLRGLVARFMTGQAAYTSRPYPKYAKSYGDYDHLARVLEWSLGGEGEG